MQHAFKYHDWSFFRHLLRDKKFLDLMPDMCNFLNYCLSRSLFNSKTKIMEPHDSLPVSDRRTFINTLSAGAALFGLSSFQNSQAIYEDYMKTNNQEDPEAWVNKIQGKHKMVFDATQPHGIMPFAWPRVFLMTNQATGSQQKDCCAVVVLRHDAIPYAFEDRLWEKYKFGEVFKAPDPQTNEPSKRNPFWKPKPGSFVVPGIGEVAIGINQLQESGVLFCVCSAAINVYSNIVAGGMNLKADEVQKDWLSGLLPGIQPVPAGVWALGRAQEKGCAYVFAS
jgi:intracellular sulfur oxidation DsrE/DsrF family protein